MPNKVTREALEARLKCRYKAHLKLTGEQGQPHDYERMLQEGREHVRATAQALLLARHPGEEVPRGLPLTADLLKRGLPLLLDATFEDEDLSLCFDALLRVGGDSSLGGFHYQPVLFHEAERLTPEMRLLLAALGEVLGTVQVKAPAAGVVLHGRSCTQRRPRLAGVAKQARRLHRELREARAAPAPRLVLNDHCAACEFRQRCHAEATARDELSLLRGLGEAEVAKYAKRGILTAGQLACTFRPPRRARKPEQRKASHSHALQALSVREKKVHVLGTPTLPDSTRRLYLDLEGDPERGFCYLAGVVVWEGQKEERHSFWIDSAEEEPLLLGRLLDLTARFPDTWVFTYGSYEATFLRRVGKAAGRQQEVEALLARTLNVLSVVYLHVYFPVHSNGLKEVAGHLGFRWSEPEASGLLSIVWRRRWEQVGDPAWKERLLTYNLEDCHALRLLTDFLYEACAAPQQDCSETTHGPAVARAEKMQFVSSRGEWGKVDFAVPDFEFANERAYFDYQREKVYARSSKALRKSQARQRRHKGKKNLRADRTVKVEAGACPFCGGADLTRKQDGRLYRLFYDLRLGGGAVRRRVTRFTTSWHRCVACCREFLPQDYLRLEEHGHGLKSWAMYKHVTHRATFEAIAEEVNDCFGLPAPLPVVYHFKPALARLYEPTYQGLLAKLIIGPLIHADETEVHLKGKGKGYVWVFTNLEEVLYLYKPNREGDFLKEMLKDFKGVLVSDFYAAYDSLGCPQQKCLIHLMRDLNNDIQSSPWDQELKALASSFGALLRLLVEAIDRHGLKARHLGRHRKDVDQFFDAFNGAEYRSEVAEGYRCRLLKNRDKLFTFLDHDGVPWNNNNAEHAVKRFAYYREVADGLLTEKGLSDYLVLLSLRMSCKYKGLSFLKFLLSRQTDIDTFAREGARRALVPALELYPEGVPPYHPSRRQTWDKMHRREEQARSDP